MSSNYASILGRLYIARDKSDMHSDIELAYAVTEVLVDTLDLPAPWLKLRKEARGLIKTRAKRSRNRFRMQFKVALEQSDILLTPSSLERPGVDLPADREERFRERIRNPRFMRVSQDMPTKVSIEPIKEPAIITEDQTFCTEERENDFIRRLKNPESLRRGPKNSV